MSPRWLSRLSIAALALVCARGVGATPVEDLLAPCRALESPAARLACYDAAAGGPVERPVAARPVAGATLPAQPAPAPPAPAAAGGGGSDFGLTPAQVKPAARVLEALQAIIAGLSVDHIGHALVTLDNGQVWFVTDADARLGIGDKVTINRAALGSFMMITTDRHAYKVRRSR